MQNIKIVITFMLVILFLMSCNISASNDVYVKGYYRQDGTYVRPHIRSSPDAYKYNNYGPSKNSYELRNPKARDNDKDGIPNYLDRDDDNDGIHDDYDKSQY